MARHVFCGAALDKHTTTHNKIEHLREQLIDSLSAPNIVHSGVARRNKEILLVSDILFKPYNTHSQHSARFLRTLCAQLRRPRNFSETRSAQQHTHCVTWLAWLAAFMYIESIGALPPQIPVHKTGVVCSATQRAISNERNYLTFRIVRAGQQFASIAINERTHIYSAKYAA